VAAWADRIGLLLQFLAFWFVAPELMGRVRLEHMKLATERLFQALVMLPVGVALIGGVDALVLWRVDEDLHSMVRAGAVAVALMAGMAWMYFAMRRRTFRKIIQRLEDDDAFRGMLAKTGAGCFTIGFVLQFLATYG
jgi:putative flippase GtrA